MKEKLIGVDLGGTTVKFAILTTDGTIEHRWSIQTNILNEGRNIVPDMIASIKEQMELHKLDATDFKGIGVGTPGSVNYEAGTVNNAFNLNWDYPVSLKSDLEKELAIPTVLENDANVAALGERWRGAGEDAANVAFVTLGTGVGGGIIIDGKIVHGMGGAAGEIGHVTIDQQGFKCTCGKVGCLETVASATGIVRVAQSMAAKYTESSSLKELVDDGEEISAKLVLDLAKSDDQLAVQVVEKVCDQLGLALANVAMTINPEYIIIGGGVSNAGEFLLNHIQTAYNKYVFAAVADSTTLRLATLGNEAGVIGAASLVSKK